MKTNLLLFIFGIIITTVIIIVPYHLIGISLVDSEIILFYYLVGVLCRFTERIAQRLSTTKVDYWIFVALGVVILISLLHLLELLAIKIFFSEGINKEDHNMSIHILLFIGFSIGYSYNLFVSHKKKWKVGFNK